MEGDEEEGEDRGVGGGMCECNRKIDRWGRRGGER